MFSVRSAAVLGRSNVRTSNAPALLRISPAPKPAAPEDGRTPLNRYRPEGRAPSIGARRRRSAFTLIELILVMAMLLIVLSVSAPSLAKFFRGRTLDSEARRFVSLTRYGQSRAVTEGVPMMLWIDTKEGTYGLQQETSYTDLDDKAVDFELGKDLKIEVTDFLTQSNLFTQARQTQPPRQILQGGQMRQAGRELATIRFLPEGFLGESSPQSVLIREGEQDEVWITQSRNRLNYEISTNVLHNVRR